MKKETTPKKQSVAKDQKIRNQSPHSPEYPLIKEAVSRCVREYGKTLEKLAKND